jgi:RNA polymerase sigma factor (sigma-70 family)
VALGDQRAGERPAASAAADQENPRHPLIIVGDLTFGCAGAFTSTLMNSIPPFQRTLEEHSEEIWRYLRGMVGTQAAEDCFQETFLAALRAYPRLRPDSNVRAWLFTIAHRKALDHARQLREAPLGEHDAAGEPERPNREIWSAVATLPPRQRAAVLLRYGGDLAHREIAAAIGCSEEAARRSLHEGLKRLRETI